MHSCGNDSGGQTNSKSDNKENIKQTIIAADITKTIQPKEKLTNPDCIKKESNKSIIAADNVTKAFVF